MKLRDLEFPFWFDDERAGATPEEIRKFEEDAQVKLPEEFRQALMLRDGGVSAYSSFRADERYVPIPAFFGVEALRRAQRHRGDHRIPSGVIIIASGGHEWLGLDYREGPNPKVVFQESEDSPLEAVADSFEALLDGLSED